MLSWKLCYRGSILQAAFNVLKIILRSILEKDFFINSILLYEYYINWNLIHLIKQK